MIYVFTYFVKLLGFIGLGFFVRKQDIEYTDSLNGGEAAAAGVPRRRQQQD